MRYHWLLIICQNAPNLFRTSYKTMKITYYGHACFSVEIQKKHLLFDPFISSNPLASHINVDAVPADFILITHGHGDHLEDAPVVALRTGAPIITNVETGGWLGKKGLKEVSQMNHGGEKDLGVARVKFVNAIHSSSLPDGTYGGNPGGFVVESSEGSFYYSGDTALTYDMKLLGEFHKLDWAALCIGGNFTMGVEDAIRAASFAGVNQVLGVHYDTFPPIRIDHAAAVEKFRKEGKTLHLPKIGNAIEL
jgi:L-ascorbate metabolism protein UlaG (beta-lactamase superfamily)